MTGRKGRLSTSAASSFDVEAALVDWLASPQAYSPAPQSVQRIETHISQVFLVGPLVYKLKRPVKYDFLDFTTLAAREHACREEVRLNRRLAPDIYQGVVPIALEKDGSFRLNGQGKVIDWLVQMWRLPAENMLDALHHRGELRPHDVERLAQLLAQFYSGLKPISLTAESYRIRCLAHVHGNLDELLAVSHAMQRSVVQRALSFQLQLLKLRPDLFDRRVKAGRIVEGHGDLRAEHICFTDPIAVFDCIEFNEEFRQLDVADELAFLAAECDYIGATWVGPRLLQRFQELSGDHPPPVLVDFYKAYRATVRAKVAALRFDQLEGSAKEAAPNEASGHLDLADRYAAPHLHPLLLVVGGLSGTGKSTLARALANELSAELLSSDVVRKELFGPDGVRQDIDSGRYQSESRERVYQEMFRRARELHVKQVSVVLDATFSSAANTYGALALKQDSRAIFLAVECRCPAEVARQRIVSRLQAGGDASEARPEVYENQRSSWEEWPEEVPHCEVDSEQPLAAQVQGILTELSRRSPA